MFDKILNHFKKGNIYCKNCKYFGRKGLTCCYILGYKRVKSSYTIYDKKIFGKEYILNKKNKCKYFKKIKN